MTEKIQNQGWNPLFPQVLPTDPLQKKLSKWFFRGVETLFSHPKNTRYCYQQNFYKEIPPFFSRMDNPWRRCHCSLSFND
jgi:hypothetical protein